MRARRGANGAKVEGLDRGVRGWGGECTRRAFRGLACNRARVSAWPWHPHTYRIPLDSAGRFPSRSREDCPSMLNEPINIDANNWRRDCHRSEGCLRTLDTVSPPGKIPSGHAPFSSRRPCVDYHPPPTPPGGRLSGRTWAKAAPRNRQPPLIPAPRARPSPDLGRAVSGHEAAFIHVMPPPSAPPSVTRPPAGA